MNKERNRIQWVDIAKGIATLLVVMGHTVSYGNTGPIIKNLIYSFHMPLFLILSGFTTILPTSNTSFLQKPRNLRYICLFLLLY